MKTLVYFQIVSSTKMVSSSFEAVARQIMARVIGVDAAARFVAAKHFTRHMIVVAEVASERGAQVAGVHIVPPSYLQSICNCFANPNPPREEVWKRMMKWLESARSKDYKTPAEIQFVHSSQHKWLSFELH